MCVSEARAFDNDRERTRGGIIRYPHARERMLAAAHRRDGVWRTAICERYLNIISCAHARHHVRALGLTRHRRDAPMRTSYATSSDAYYFVGNVIFQMNTLD